MTEQGDPNPAGRIRTLLVARLLFTTQLVGKGFHARPHASTPALGWSLAETVLLTANKVSLSVVWGKSGAERSKNGSCQGGIP